MPIYAEATMPKGFDGFPWPDRVHMWDLGCGYGLSGLRLRFWYMPSTPAETLREAMAGAFQLHAEIWDWLEQRFELTRIPEIESEGKAFLDRHGKQVYDRYAIWGIFYLGGRKPAPDSLI
jgi:hypothetical protein